MNKKDVTEQAWIAHRRQIIKTSQAKRRQVFKESGLCIQCGRFEPVRGKTLCPKCLAKQRAAQLRYRDRLERINKA